MPLKTEATVPADQADILAANETLTTDLATARTELVTEKESVTRLTSENTKLTADLAVAVKGSETLTLCLGERTKERDALKLENDGLKVKMSDFDKSVAASVAKAGIRGTVVEPKTVATDKPLTATEKVLASKGAESIEALKK